MNNQTPEHYNANQLVTYKVINGDSITYPTEKVAQIEYMLDQSRRAEERLSELRLRISDLEDRLVGWIDNDTNASDIVSEICEIFAFNPTKEVDFEATVSVTGTVSVPLSEFNDFDIDTAIDVEVTSYQYHVDSNAEIDYIGIV